MATELNLLSSLEIVGALKFKTPMAGQWEGVELYFVYGRFSGRDLHFAVVAAASSLSLTWYPSSVDPGFEWAAIRARKEPKNVSKSPFKLFHANRRCLPGMKRTLNFF